MCLVCLFCSVSRTVMRAQHPTNPEVEFNAAPRSISRPCPCQCHCHSLTSSATVSSIARIAVPGGPLYCAAALPLPLFLHSIRHRPCRPSPGAAGAAPAPPASAWPVAIAAWPVATGSAPLGGGSGVPSGQLAGACSCQKSVATCCASVTEANPFTSSLRLHECVVISAEKYVTAGAACDGCNAAARTMLEATCTSHSAG